MNPASTTTRTAPLPRRAKFDMYFIDHGQVTDTQGDPLTRDELVGLADRLGDHTTATPGALPALPVTVEIIRGLVHASGRALRGGEVAALSVHVRSLSVCSSVRPHRPEDARGKTPG